MMTKVTIESLGTLTRGQAVLTRDMSQALAQHGPTARVEVTRLHTAFGRYVTGWRLLTGEDALRIVHVEGR